jgi:plastocyanin
VRRLATVAGVLFCVLCALGAPAAGAPVAPEYVTVAVSPASLEYVTVAFSRHRKANQGAPPGSLEYVTVALSGRATAHHGAAHRVRSCKPRARKRPRHERRITAHSHRRGHAHARRCHKRHSAAHAPASTSPAAAPGPDVLTATGTSGSTSAGGAGSPGSGSSPGQAPSVPPTVPRVQVTATEYSYTMSRTSVPAGRVIVEFVNRGQDEHNLRLIEREGDLAGSFPNTLSGGVSDQSLILRAGSYTLFCSLPEHESKGMRATLLVQ